jgi:hypothetical protein
MTPPTVTALRRWVPPEGDCLTPTACFQCTVQVLCFDTRTRAFTSRSVRTLFSPSDPYSVVFPLRRVGPLRAFAELAPLAVVPTWFGSPCTPIYVRIGLPVVGQSIPRPFRLLALLPLQDVDDAPPLLRLGAEFLQATGANVELTANPCEGRLIIPARA